MLNFKKSISSQQKVEGDFTFVPRIEWPVIYQRPDFELWRNRYKESAVRNLMALMFYYQEISVSDISNFLGISSSRVHAIIKATKKRLFGANYVSSKEKIEGLLFSISKLTKPNPMLNQLAKISIEAGNKTELQAVLYAVDRLMMDREGLNTFHHALAFAEKSGKPIDLELYRYISKFG